MSSSPRGRNVLVTGGAGYIGSHTVLALLEAGDDVVIVDNLDNASPVAVDRVRELGGLAPDDPRLVFARLDLRDRDGVDELFASRDADGRPIDAVVHFAGRKAVGESVERPLRYWDHNLVSTVNLVRAMVAHDVGDLVFSSSATVYGAPDRVPITESSPLRALSPYGRTKLTIEDLLRDVADDDSVDAPAGGWRIVLLRYFNPVGAHPSGRIGEDPRGVPNNLMPFAMQVAVGRRDELAVFGDDYDTPDGTCIRDYIHVVDLAEAHLAALDALDRIEGCRAVNVGTGEGSSVLEVVAAAAAAVGAEIPYRIVGRRPGDAPCVYADTSLAAELLRWRASRDLASMCWDHWRWQRDNPDGYPDA